MALHLPPPIAAFIEANKRLDLEGMIKQFRPNATFVDNDKLFIGQADICSMLQNEAIAVQAVFEPDTVREEQGEIVLEGVAHGKFPGSPLRFTYRFTIVGESIGKRETSVWP